MREYTNKIMEDLKNLENESLTDYLSVNEDVGRLYSQLDNPNSCLDRIEKIVGNFQHKLGDIADNVSKLQDRSSNYATQLKNRKDLDHKLHSFLSGILLSPKLIETLLESEIDKEYMAYLDEFNKILANIKKAEEAGESQAIEDVKAEVEKLRLQVCSRIRKFLLSKVKALATERTNFQIVQKNVLTNFSTMLVFLRDNHQEAYVDITNNYA